MSVGNNYTPAFAIGTAASIRVDIAWPFSVTLNDLYIWAENTLTGEIKTVNAGDFTAVVKDDVSGIYVLAENFWGVGAEAKVTVSRETDAVQQYDQHDGEALDPFELQAQLDRTVKTLQETFRIINGQEPITSLDPFIIPHAAARANTIINFDVNGDYAAFPSEYEAGVGVTFFHNSVEGETPVFGVVGFPTGGSSKYAKMSILLDTGASYPGHWVNHLTNANYFNFNQPVLSEGLQLAYVAAGTVNDILIDDGSGSPIDSGVQISDVLQKVTGGNAFRMVVTDSTGALLETELKYSGGVLQKMDNNSLTIEAGTGLEGFDLYVNGGALPSRLLLTSQGVTTTLESEVSLTTLKSNAPLLISSADIRLFHDQPTASRALNLYGGATGGQGVARITVNELSANQARFGGDVAEWNFIGAILENGIPILEGLSQGQTIATSFVQADIQNDVDGDYYLLVHSFDSVESVHISVYDEDGQEIQLTNVKDSVDPDNRIKVYVTGYTPIVGTFRISAFIGAPSSTITGDLTADEIAAIKNAPTPGTALNPFVTVADQVGAQLTVDELAGIQNSDTPLTLLNPVVSVADLQLTSDELLGIQNAPTPLSATNPVASVEELVHTMGGTSHTPDTLAGLNTKISDATLDAAGDSRPPTSHNNGAHSETYITTAGVTYEALLGNSDIGQVASTVAAGNDSRFLTAAQKWGVDNAPTAITAINPVASVADLNHQFLLFSDRKAQNTAAQTLVDSTWNNRELVSDYNSIIGALISGNSIVLPAGTYELFDLWATTDLASGNKLRLQNSNDNSTIVDGNYVDIGAATSSSGLLRLPNIRFTITQAKNFFIQHYFQLRNVSHQTAGRVANIPGSQEVYLAGGIRRWA